MRITEEKVSASLRDMHISNEFKPHNCCFDNNVGSMDVSKSVFRVLISCNIFIIFSRFTDYGEFHEYYKYK